MEVPLQNTAGRPLQDDGYQSSTSPLSTPELLLIDQVPSNEASLQGSGPSTPDEGDDNHLAFEKAAFDVTEAGLNYSTENTASESNHSPPLSTSLWTSPFRSPQWSKLYPSTPSFDEHTLDCRPGRCALGCRAIVALQDTNRESMLQALMKGPIPIATPLPCKYFHPTTVEHICPDEILKLKLYGNAVELMHQEVIIAAEQASRNNSSRSSRRVVDTNHRLGLAVNTDVSSMTGCVEGYTKHFLDGEYSEDEHSRAVFLRLKGQRPEPDTLATDPSLQRSCAKGACELAAPQILGRQSSPGVLWPAMEVPPPTPSTSEALEPIRACLRGGSLEDEEEDSESFATYLRNGALGDEKGVFRRQINRAPELRSKGTVEKKRGLPPTPPYFPVRSKVVPRATKNSGLPLSPPYSPVKSKTVPRATGVSAVDSSTSTSDLFRSWPRNAPFPPPREVYDSPPLDKSGWWRRPVCATELEQRLQFLLLNGYVRRRDGAWERMEERAINCELRGGALKVGDKQILRQEPRPLPFEWWWGVLEDEFFVREITKGVGMEEVNDEEVLPELEQDDWVAMQARLPKPTTKKRRGRSGRKKRDRKDATATIAFSALQKSSRQASARDLRIELTELEAKFAMLLVYRAADDVRLAELESALEVSRTDRRVGRVTLAKLEKAIRIKKEDLRMQNVTLEWITVKLELVRDEEKIARKEWEEVLDQERRALDARDGLEGGLRGGMLEMLREEEDRWGVYIERLMGGSRRPGGGSQTSLRHDSTMTSHASASVSLPHHSLQPLPMREQKLGSGKWRVDVDGLGRVVVVRAAAAVDGDARMATTSSTNSPPLSSTPSPPKQTTKSITSSQPQSPCRVTELAEQQEEDGKGERSDVDVDAEMERLQRLRDEDEKWEEKESARMKRRWLREGKGKRGWEESRKRERARRGRVVGIWMWGEEGEW